MAKKIASGFCFLCMLALCSTLRADQAGQMRVENYVAVMDMRCGTGVPKDLSSTLTEIVIEELVKLKIYTVIDRANRDKILEEQGFQATGCVDEACSVEMGRLLGVGKMVVGSVSKLEDTYIVNLQLINVATATVEKAASTTCRCDSEGFIVAIRNTLRKLVDAPLLPQPTLQPPENVPPAYPMNGGVPSPDEIKFIAATQDQQKKCPQGMKFIPAGWFMMGCNSGKDAHCEPDEQPFHAVFLNSYCIDEYEYPNKKGEIPMHSVEWEKAIQLCVQDGKRLPTEAEWEKAARGTDGRVYPWGDSNTDLTVEQWKSLKKLSPSGSAEWDVSPYGVYDTVGNMFEWTSDWYLEGYYSGSPDRNPKGPGGGPGRVLRGGSKFYDPVTYRTSTRVSDLPTAKKKYYSFRCAK